jgi:hypothetical protein
VTKWAERRWPKAAWITGEGSYASVSLCPPAPTAILFETRAEAEGAKRGIDVGGCGGRCVGDHLVVKKGSRRPRVTGRRNGGQRR